MDDFNEIEHQLRSQQRALASFGEFTLKSDDLDEILTEACRLVCEALGTDFAKVMELQADGQTLLVRAGVGWEPGVVGNTTVKAEEGTSEHYAFEAGEPVISANLDHEDRFIYPDFLRLHGVMAFVNVPIVGRGGEGSYGMLQVDTRTPRDFSEHDITFLRTYANLLAATVARAQTIQQLAHDSKRHREGEERLHATQEHANIAIGECDAEGRYVHVNSGFTALTGYSREELLGRSYFDFTHPDDLSAERERQRHQLDGDLKACTLEKRFRHKDGSFRWMLISSSAVYDADGRFQYAIRVCQDIDQRKRAEERLAAQVRELHHRVRNVLATVQGMMGATARSAESVEEFKYAFSGRLAAIARAHTLLTMDNWETAPFEALLRDELQALKPVDSQRISLEGPHVDLPASLAIPLSMGIHELADNAIRHGALSTIVGRVKVDWSVRDDDKTTLVLNWLETNGPPVEPPARTGYGTVLLTKVLPAQADARCTLTFDPSGLAFHLEAPLAHAP